MPKIGDKFAKVERKCKACNGTGKSSKGRECVPCQGKGLRLWLTGK